MPFGEGRLHLRDLAESLPGRYIFQGRTGGDGIGTGAGLEVDEDEATARHSTTRGLRSMTHEKARLVLLPGHARSRRQSGGSMYPRLFYLPVPSPPCGMQCSVQCHLLRSTSYCDGSPLDAVSVIALAGHCSGPARTVGFDALAKAGGAQELRPPPPLWRGKK